MRRYRRGPVAVVVSIFAALVACGGGAGEPSGGDSVTTIAEGRDVGTLTTGEQTTLCREVTDYVARALTPEQAKRFSCAFGASISATFARAFKQDAVAACQKSFDECLARPIETRADASAEDASPSTCSVTSCKAITVGEIAACARESSRSLGSAADGFSCSASATENDAADSTGPACARYRAACSDE